MITATPTHCLECGTEIQRLTVAGSEVCCPHCGTPLPDDYDKPDQPPCAHCGSEMLMMYGAGWDYDRWICPQPGCDFEIELATSTHVDMDGNPLQ